MEKEERAQWTKTNKKDGIPLRNIFFNKQSRADVYGGCYNMFIYSDIVDHQLVWESYVPLLRSINVTNISKSHCILMFDKLHYVHVSRDALGDI